MSVDDLRKQLTFKGLQESDYQVSPLKKFSGVLKDYEPTIDPKFTNADGSARVKVLFRFDDVEVIECQPGQSYAFPVAEFTIPHNSKANSKWGVLGKSVELIDPRLDIADLVGKRAVYMLEPHEFYSGKDANGQAIMKAQDTWVVVEIEGQSAGGSVNGTGNVGTDPKKTALSILFGKTKQEFEALVLKDPVVKKDGGLVSEIIGNHFIPAMEESGYVHKDGDGRYQPGPA